MSEILATVLFYNNNMNENTLKISPLISKMLHNANVKIERVLPITSSCDLANTVGISLKECEYVFLIADTMDFDILTHINCSISKVFNEKVLEKCVNSCSKTVSLLEHIKILSSQDFSGNNVVLYIQGLFIILFRETLELPVDNYIVPFIKRRLVKNYLKRVLYIDQEIDKYDVPVDIINGVLVNVNKNHHYLTITISSVNLKELLSTEQLLKDLFKEAILNAEECINIEETVYNYNFSYVKQSIEIIEKCFETYEPENVLIAFNGGKDCMVLLHLSLAVLKRNYSDRNLRPLCLYVQSADPFEELEEFVEHCRQFYNLNLLRFNSKVKDALNIVLKSKPNIKACLMGTRRNDPFASHLKEFQMTDSSWPQVMRVSPLLDWHYSFIWDYLLDLQVPYCKLYDQGYTSIGSCLNTKLNPYLYYYDPKQNIKKYLPAYKLLDATKERSGRC